MMRKFILALTICGCGGNAPFAESDASVGVDAASESAVFLDTSVDGNLVQTDGSVRDVAQGDASGGGTALAGTWRLVSFETSAGGASLHLTDSNRTVYVAGVGNMQGRTNGWMTLRAGRASLASCLLFNDHIFPTPGVTDYRTAFQAVGATAPGTLDGTTFRLSGAAAPYVYTQNNDGTISYVDAQGNHSTWQRATPQAPLTSILATGQATQFNARDAQRFQHARVTLVWDQAGTGTATSQDSALQFIGGYATYPIAVSSAPNDARVAIGNVDVALAYVVVYDDVNDDRRFTSADTVRGISSIAIAFRAAGAANETFASSQFQDLFEGFQFVNVHIDYAASGNLGIAPLDLTRPIAPDILVNDVVETMAIPNILP